MILILFAALMIGPGSLLFTAPTYGLLTGLILTPWIGSAAGMLAAVLILIRAQD